MEQFLQRFLELKSQIFGIVDVGAFWENIIVHRAARESVRIDYFVLCKVFSNFNKISLSKF